MILDPIKKIIPSHHIESGQGWILLFTALMLSVLGWAGLWLGESVVDRPPFEENTVWIEIVSPGMPPHLKPFSHPPDRSELLESLGFMVPEDLTDEKITRSCRAVIHPSSSRIAIRPLSGQAALALGRKIDVNLAAYPDFTLISGIGPIMSRRIIEERETCGPFASLEDLARVYGIGPETIERIRPFIQAGKKEEGD